MSAKKLKTAMNMIASAGDGRNLLNQALSSAKNANYDQADQILKEAFENIKIAHIAQTQIIQASINSDNEDEAATLLFTHAQDTLMTINSEYLLAKEIIEIMKSFDERLCKMEEIINGK